MKKIEELSNEDLVEAFDYKVRIFHYDPCDEMKENDPWREFTEKDIYQEIINRMSK